MPASFRRFVELRAGPARLTVVQPNRPKRLALLAAATVLLLIGLISLPVPRAGELASSQVHRSSSSSGLHLVILTPGHGVLHALTAHRSPATADGLWTILAILALVSIAARRTGRASPLPGDLQLALAPSRAPPHRRPI